jgi:FAD/FMN-containing dehydrogenase
VSTTAAIFEQAFGAERVGRAVPLAPFTTFKVGGPADLLIETQNSDEIIRAVKLAHGAGLKVTMLGGGSNVLIADAGIRGLVIRPRGGEVIPVGDRLVRADAAVTINGLVRWTINRGYAGLEAWAGTPGTVGGAIFGNAHWKQVNIGDLVESVRLLKPDGTLLQAPADRMEFEYDYSRRDRVVGGVSRDRRRRSGGAAHRGPRVARVQEADPAARIAECRLHLHESRSGARSHPGGHSAVGGRPGGPRRLEGRGAGRRKGLADARQLHRHRRLSQGR